MKQSVKGYSKIGIFVLMLMLVSISLIGCSSKEKAPDVSQEPSQGDQATPADKAEPEVIQPSVRPAQPEPVKPNEPGVGEPKAFAYSEVTTILELDTDTLAKTFGEPKEIQDEDFFGETGKVYVYKDASFRLGYFDEQTPKGMIYEAKIANDTISAPRGIKIGDSLTSVMEKFPRTAPADSVEPSPNDPKVEYHLLYGEYVYMGDYGYVEYRGDQAIAVTYGNEGIVISIKIDKDKVTSYDYAMPTT